MLISAGGDAVPRGRSWTLHVAQCPTVIAPYEDFKCRDGAYSDDNADYATCDIADHACHERYSDG